MRVLRFDGDATILVSLPDEAVLWRRAGMRPIDMSVDGETIAVADKHTTEVWRVVDPAPVLVLDRIRANKVWLAPNGEHFVAAGYGTTGVLRRVSDGAAIGSQDCSRAVAWDPSGVRVALVDRYGRLTVWRIDGSTVQGPERVRAVTFASSTTLIVTSDDRHQKIELA
jgi:hypothetical protein